MNGLNVQINVLWRVSQVANDVSIILYRPIWKITSRVRVSFLEEATCYLRRFVVLHNNTINQLLKDQGRASLLDIQMHWPSLQGFIGLPHCDAWRSSATLERAPANRR